MLTSVVLMLSPRQNSRLPLHLGRAHYAATLALLDSVCPGLSDQIHDWPGSKPLTCSGLNGPTERSEELVKVDKGQEYWVRMTGLTPPVSQALIEACLARRPERWQLDRCLFDVVGAACNPLYHAWSGSIDYETLAQRHLLAPAAAEARTVTLQLFSPTAFKSNEMQMPLPLPRLLFGNLIDRWNAFSPVPLNPEMRDFGEQAIEIGEFQLASRLVRQKSSGKRKSFRSGAVGTVSYRAQVRDRYWLGLMQLLADFALFSGVGVQTSTGMGQVRRLDS